MTPSARPTRLLAAALVAGCALTLSACNLRELGRDRPAQHRTAAAPHSQTTPATPATRSGGAAMSMLAPIVLFTRHSAKFGTLVVDVRGRTLYRSNHDTARPPRSHCTGKCLLVWHPALVRSADVRAVGIDARLVGTIPAAHGQLQLTLAGWPLYTFTGDHKPGDVNGQCGGVFFAVTPAGKPNPM